MSTEDHSSLDPTIGLSSGDLIEVLKESADEVFMTMIGMVGVLVDQAGGGEDVKLIDEDGESPVEFEAVVEFSGPRSGAVILRAGREGALDIARGLLMLGEEEAVEIEEIMDALGECANMLSGSLKCKALDPAGGFTLGTPSIGRRVELDFEMHLGGLVYRLAKGCTSVEVWMDQPS